MGCENPETIQNQSKRAQDHRDDLLPGKGAIACVLPTEGRSRFPRGLPQTKSDFIGFITQIGDLPGALGQQDLARLTLALSGASSTIRRMSASPSTMKTKYLRIVIGKVPRCMFVPPALSQTRFPHLSCAGKEFSHVLPWPKDLPDFQLLHK